MAKIDTPANDQEDMWQEWAVKAQAGDKRAYTDLLRAIVPYIRNVVAPRLANPEWADDIVQEVLLSVHRALHTYSPDRPFKPWLYAIISFRKTDFLRRHYSARSHLQAGTDDVEFQKNHVTDNPLAGELKDMEEALQSLPEKQRKLFAMMRIEGYTAREVAEQMNMSESAVKVSVHRTADKLKKMMEE